MKPPLIYSLSVSSAKSVSKKPFSTCLTDDFLHDFSDVFYMVKRHFLHVLETFLHVLPTSFTCFIDDILQIFCNILYIFSEVF